MENIRRRRLLTVTAGSAAAAVVAGSGAGIARAADHEALVGSWIVAATAAGAPPAPPRVLVSFTDDGVALRTAPLQQAAPPALGVEKMFISATHGAWLRKEDGTYGLTWVGLAFDDAGRFLATQHVLVAVAVNEMLDGFSGPYRVEFVGGDGQVLASVGGTVEGRRIEVEPLA